MAISLSEFSFDFEVPGIDEVPEELREEALNDIGEYLLDSILDYVGSSRSPVAGGEFRASLSPDYAKRAGKDRADLDLTGSMLNSLEYSYDADSGTVTLGIFEEDEIPKAYNHNVGDTLPKRQFLPEEEETFKAEIIRGVGRILSEYLEEDGEES